jgi:hypothetical protein
MAEPEPTPAPEPTPVVVEEPKPMEEVAPTPEPVVEEAAPASMEPVVSASASEPVMPKLKQGFIGKEGQFLKNWNIRYFVLDNGDLSYYEKPHNLPPYGINKKGSGTFYYLMELLNEKVARLMKLLILSLVPSLKGKSLVEDGDLMVKITGGEARDILLKFTDNENKVEWMAALNEHIAYSNRT